MASAAEVSAAPPADDSTAPARAGLATAALIAVAAVANLDLAVANVALPSIGRAFEAGQTELDLVAVAILLGATLVFFRSRSAKMSRRCSTCIVSRM